MHRVCMFLCTAQQMMVHKEDECGSPNNPCIIRSRRRVHYPLLAVSHGSYAQVIKIIAEFVSRYLQLP